MVKKKILMLVMVFASLLSVFALFDINFSSKVFASDNRLNSANIIIRDENYNFLNLYDTYIYKQKFSSNYYGDFVYYVNGSYVFMDCEYSYCTHETDSDYIPFDLPTFKTKMRGDYSISVLHNVVNNVYIRIEDYDLDVVEYIRILDLYKMQKLGISISNYCGSNYFSTWNVDSNDNLTIEFGSDMCENSTYYNLLVHLRDFRTSSNSYSMVDSNTKPTISGVVNNGKYEGFATPVYTSVVCRGYYRVGLTGEPQYHRSGYNLSAFGYIYYYVEDCFGNYSYRKFSISKAKPKISGVSAYGSYASARTISLSFPTGKSEAYYTINGGSKINISSGSFTISAEGTIYIYAKDLNGEITSFYFYIDYTKPTISGVVNGGKYNSVQTVSVNDNIGINYSYYCINGGDDIEFEDSFSVVGSATIYVYCEDDCGNYTSLTYYQDIEAPTISGVNVVYTTNVVKMSTDYIVGLLTINDVNNYTLSITDNYSSCADIKGTYNLVVKATDEFNNSTSYTIRIVVNDVIPPIVKFGGNFIFK